jgi:hypothetical protein
VVVPLAADEDEADESRGKVKADEDEEDEVDEEDVEEERATCGGEVSAATDAFMGDAREVRSTAAEADGVGWGCGCCVVRCECVRSE